MNTRNKLILIGASGHGKVAAEIALKMKAWEHIFFVDDDPSLKSCMGIEVIGDTEVVRTYVHDCDFIVAIGDNKARSSVQQRLEAIGASMAKLIHPSAVVSEYASVGAGTVVMAGAVINGFASVGKGCIINTGSTVDHDGWIGDYVHLSPGVHLGGTVHIGQGTWIGIGGTVIHNISIAEYCTIGAGAAVVKDITESGSYAGVPARRLK